MAPDAAGAANRSILNSPAGENRGPAVAVEDGAPEH
jgi:hypothetical protein